MKWICIFLMLFVKIGVSDTLNLTNDYTMVATPTNDVNPTPKSFVEALSGVVSNYATSQRLANNITNSPTFAADGTGIIALGTNCAGTNAIYFPVNGTNYVITFY